MIQEDERTEPFAFYLALNQIGYTKSSEIKLTPYKNGSIVIKKAKCN